MTTLKTLSTTAIATVLASGIALADPAMDYETKPEAISFTAEEITMAQAVVGQPVMYADGSMLGTVTKVETNGIDEPQFHVDVMDYQTFNAEKVVISVARDALKFGEDTITIQTSAAELMTQADRAKAREIIYIDVDA